MNKQIVAGQRVALNSFLGVIVRQVVSVDGSVLAVTTPEEAAAAQREGREPVCVGFPLHDVLPIDIAERFKHNVQYGEHVEHVQAGRGRKRAGRGK